MEFSEFKRNSADSLVSAASLSVSLLALVFRIFAGTSLSDSSVVCDRRLFFSDGFPGVFPAGAPSAVDLLLLGSEASASMGCSLGSLGAEDSFFFFFFLFFFSSSSPSAAGRWTGFPHLVLGKIPAFLGASSGGLFSICRKTQRVFPPPGTSRLSGSSPRWPVAPRLPARTPRRRILWSLRSTCIWEC